MRYETPKLSTAAELYETPMLLDVEDIAGAGVCITGGGCSSEVEK